jgi:uncharacterized small protein (DUF1192 family)
MTGRIILPYGELEARFREQMAEIERLRALLTKATPMETECCREDANGTHAPCSPYAELQDENARLRAALERIASETAATWVSDVAKEALKRQTAA